MIERATGIGRAVVAAIPRADIEAAGVIDLVDGAAAQIDDAVAAIGPAVIVGIAPDGEIAQ